MGQISPPARELYAEHTRAMANLTAEQRAALEREAMAKNASRLNNRPWRDNLIAIYERLAATP